MRVICTPKEMNFEIFLIHSKLQTDILKDPSEFNKPNCLYHDDGNCPDNLLSKNQACPTKFVKCYKGWQCEFVCKNNTEVYNYKSNNCQEQFACQKSMREDL